MINILTNPEAIDIAGNGLKFEVEGSEYSITEGVNAQISITKIGPLADGNVFKLLNQDSGISENITVKVSPDFEQNEMLLSQQISIIVAGLLAIDFVSKYYIITYAGSVITIKMRTQIAHAFPFLITNLPAAFNYSGLITGVAPVTKTDYSISGKLFDVADNDSLISEFTLSPDTEAKATVKIGELLSDFVKPQIPLFNQLVAVYNAFNYRVHFAEKYEVSSVMRTNNATIFNGLTLTGKMDSVKAKTFSLSAYLAAKNWLNTIKQSAYVPYETDFMLYWLNYTAYTAIAIEVTATFTDGTTATFTMATPTVLSNQFLRINTSYISSEILALYPELECLKFTVILKNGANELLEPYVIYTESKALFNQTFSFINEFGQLETFYTTGTQTQTLQTKRNTALTIENNVLSAIEDAYDKFEVNTGPLYRTEAEALKQCLLSSTIYRHDEGILTPCIPDDGSFEIIPNSLDLFELKFSYRHAYNL